MNNLQNAGVTPRDRLNVLETRRDAKDTHEEATQENRKEKDHNISFPENLKICFPGKSHFICHVACHPQLI